MVEVTVEGTAMVEATPMEEAMIEATVIMKINHT